MKFLTIAEKAVETVSQLCDLIDQLESPKPNPTNIRQASFALYEETQKVIQSLQPIRSELLVGNNRGALLTCKAENVLREAMDDLWNGWQLSQRVPHEDEIAMAYRFSRAGLSLSTSISYLTGVVMCFQEDQPKEEKPLPELSKIETKYLMACYAYGSLMISEDKPVPGVRITTVRKGIAEKLIVSCAVRIKDVTKPEHIVAGLDKTRIEIVPGSESVCVSLIEKYFGKGWPSRLANGDYNHPMKDE